MGANGRVIVALVGCAVACGFAACGGTTGQESSPGQATQAHDAPMDGSIDATDDDASEAGAQENPPPPEDDDASVGCYGDGLVPDSTGFVAAITNLSGINGAWRLYRDCDDYALLEAGTPQPGVNCSLVTAPAPGGPFVPQPESAQMCTKGSTVQDIMDMDTALEWGAYIALDMNDVNGAAEDFDAKAAGIKGFCFYMTGYTIPNFRMRFVTDQGFTDRNWYQVTSFHEGWHKILFSDLGQITPTNIPFDPSKLVSIEIEIPSTELDAVPWDFCIDGLVALN